MVHRADPGGRHGVALDQHEGGGGDILRGAPQARHEAPHQRGLPGGQVAPEQDEVTGGELPRQLPAEGLRLLRGGGDPSHGDSFVSGTRMNSPFSSTMRRYHDPG